MPDKAQTISVANVQFEDVGKNYYFNYDNIPDIEIEDYVIVETSRGRQIGQVRSFETIPDTPRGYRPILRIASPQDLVSQQIWQSKAGDALVMCMRKAAEIGGFDRVKFHQASYNFDGSLLIILFSSEEKVNIHKLRSALRRTLRTKVEMHQIGPRDVAKALEGFGACGVVRCCARFLTEFSPISIKMAKTQNISLNPSEITGICGRLRCCLAYEYELYREAVKKLPKRGKWVETPLGEGKIISLMPLEGAAIVLIDETREIISAEDMTIKSKPKPAPSEEPDEAKPRQRSKRRGRRRN